MRDTNNTKQPRFSELERVGLTLHLLKEVEGKPTEWDRLHGVLIAKHSFYPVLKQYHSGNYPFDCEAIAGRLDDLNAGWRQEAFDDGGYRCQCGHDSSTEKTSVVFMDVEWCLKCKPLAAPVRKLEKRLDELTKEVS
jgi:hypothetical protein